MTRRSKLDEAFPIAIVEMHPDDARQLRLVSGDWVKITSRRGQIECRVMVTGRSPQGTVFLPFHFVEAAANILTLDKIDPRAKIPDFKMAAVKLEKIEAAPVGACAGRARSHQGSNPICALAVGREAAPLKLSVAIIAGGKSVRMGRDKAFVKLAGKSLIQHVIERSQNLGQTETILVANQPKRYRHLGLTVFSDVWLG